MSQITRPPINQRCAGPTFDYLIVGAGFAGSVLAERLARGSNKRVLIVDKRAYIGGNAYTKAEVVAASILEND